MLAYLSSRLIMITCGLLYPAFCSYKAIKEKNARAYIRWMTYWIVFALYTVAEVFVDPLLSFWFPFYYELKTILILGLVSAGGSHFAYRRIIHPNLVQHEHMIEAFIRDFKSRVTDFLYQWGSQIFAAVSEQVWRAALRARSRLAVSVDQDYTNRLNAQRDDADGPGGIARSYSYEREALDAILRREDGMSNEDLQTPYALSEHFPEAPLENETRPPGRTRAKAKPKKQNAAGRRARRNSNPRSEECPDEDIPMDLAENESNNAQTARRARRARPATEAEIFFQAVEVFKISRENCK